MTTQIDSAISAEVRSPIVVALDYADMRSAMQMAEQLDPKLCRVKVGKELFTVAGPAVIDALHTQGFQVFLDLKFHDIPSTVAKAVKAAAAMGVWMVNVHASGGEGMMRMAKAAIEEQQARTLLIAVTVLTSFTDTDLQQIGVTRSIDEQVQNLAMLAQASGLDGVVCSPREASTLKSACGKDFLLVTPGVRQQAVAKGDDQHRVMTARNAIDSGSDYLVIGRPITQAKEPIEALQAIVDTLAS